MPRYYGLDILRFGCALAVVFYHYFFTTGNIYPFAGAAVDVDFPVVEWFARYLVLGVEIFFVISGFVIGCSAKHKDAKTFLFARVLRIYPAYWICCTISYIAISFASFTSATATEYLVNLTLLQTLFHIKDLDGVYWTLLYEIIFYFWMWLLILFRQIKHLEGVLFVGLVLSVVLYLLEFQDSDLPTIIKLFSLQKYLCFFALGILTSSIIMEGFTKRRVVMVMLSLILSGVEVYTGLAHKNRVWSGYLGGANAYNLPLACGLFYIFFVVFVLAVRKEYSFKHARIIRVLGNSSYPLYLLHGVFGLVLIEKLLPVADKYVVVPFITLLMVGAAIFIHQYAEKPLRRGLTHLFRKLGIEVR